MDASRASCSFASVSKSEASRFSLSTSAISSRTSCRLPLSRRRRFQARRGQRRGHLWMPYRWDEEQKLAAATPSRRPYPKPLFPAALSVHGAPLEEEPAHWSTLLV